MPRRPPGIWAMEGNWSSRATDVRTVQPVLEALKDAGTARAVHRKINTPQDLAAALKQWSQAQYKRYDIGYLAMHGSPGVVYAGRKKIDLFDFAAALPPGTLTGKVLHFGSCSVLKNQKESQRLFDALGAKALTGFTNDVDWFESMAFELLLFDALTYYQRLDAVERYLCQRAGDLARHLGFVMVSRRKGRTTVTRCGEA